MATSQTAIDVQTHVDFANKCTEAAELAHIATAPDRIVGYVSRVQPPPTGYFVRTPGRHSVAIAWAGSYEHAETEIARLQHDGDTRALYITAQCPDPEWSIGTWLGTPYATRVHVNPHRIRGFGDSYSHTITATIAGATYSGRYYASSGDYCRLTKRKGRKAGAQ